MKYLLYFGLFLSMSSIPLSSLTTYGKHLPTHHHAHSQQTPPVIHPASVPPQMQVFEANAESNKTYVIAMDSNHPGATLITYNTPSCQANTHGTTVINPKSPYLLEFTAKEDPYCKITMQKTKNGQLKIIRETRPCNTWHGDFCSFTSLTTLTRIYPKNIP